MARYMEIDYESLGKKLRDRRRFLELTQTELAKQVGVTASFIGHIERAEKVPSVETMARLSVALDISLDELILGLKHRCEGKRCPLYDDIRALLSDYGLAGRDIPIP